MSNLYEMLGCRPGAHPAEIDLAYKTIAGSKEAGLDIEQQLELAMAHKTLLNPLMRVQYDRQFMQQPAVPVVQHRTTNRHMPVYINQNHYNFTPTPHFQPATVNWLTAMFFWGIVAFTAVTLLGVMLL